MNGAVQWLMQKLRSSESNELINNIIAAIHNLADLALFDEELCEVEHGTSFLISLFKNTNDEHLQHYITEIFRAARFNVLEDSTGYHAICKRGFDHLLYEALDNDVCLHVSNELHQYPIDLAYENDEHPCVFLLLISGYKFTKKRRITEESPKMRNAIHKAEVFTQSTYSSLENVFSNHCRLSSDIIKIIVRHTNPYFFYSHGITY